MADGDVATNTTTYAPKWPAQTHAMRCIPVACRWRILDTWWTPTTPPDAPSRPMPRPNMATHTMHVLVIVMHFPRRHMRVLLEQHVPFPAHAPPPLPRQTHARPLRRSAQSRVAVAYMLPAGMDTLSACMQPTSALFCTPWTTARVTGMGPCCSCCCCHGYMALPVAGRLLSLQRRCSVELQELP